MPWRLAIDEPQELQPLVVAMTRLARRDDRAVERVERDKQRRRAVALVAVRESARATGLHRQARLRTVQCLNLTLLVAREHQRVLGRIQIERHHLDELVLEAWIARQLEAATQMQLDAVALPDASNRGGAQSQVLGQRTRAPVRCRRRLGVQRHLQDLRFQFRRDRGPAARARRPQFPLRCSIQFDLFGNSHRSSLLERSSMPTELSSLTFEALH